ncbi:uncharacterized protein LOC113312295 [Papaver somniferum]|uniref:uncharacterized protein LOC113312295 n=1 Tax=Papaver somniferum TaxID=3469 RepID=UPI000E6F670A|nr:uncharacterized protein LOC113312295 [Papaver somniferum]
MNLWGSPGPDGFPPGFFKEHWDIVKTDIINLVQDFFKKNYLLKDYTYITLIPKVHNPSTPSDFRPISLSNITYKIISKILTNGIKPLLSKLISQNQPAFIPGRQITDNIIVVHEILHSMKTSKNKNGNMALKIDLSKVFDTIEWDFLNQTLLSFGFCSEWCQLILQCITTTSFFVLLNGVPSEFFFVTRGLRQGDPLSPYLFIICMEVLSKLLLKAEKDNLVSGIKVAKTAPSVSHLFFADDFFLFSKANLNEAKNILNILNTLNTFGEMTAQVINFQHSGIYFSPKVHNKHCKIISRIFKVRKISKNDKYLGTPLFFDKNKTNSFEPLINKYYAALQGWIRKMFNHAGRTVLIKNVLSDYPNHQMQCLKGLEIVKENSVWQVNNGRDTNIWTNLWLPNQTTPLIPIVTDNNMPTTDDAKFRKQIWNLNVRPKVNMFCRKVVSGALALGCKMFRYIKDVKPYCLLCDSNAAEDELHLNSVNFDNIVPLPQKLIDVIKTSYQTLVPTRDNNTSMNPVFGRNVNYDIGTRHEYDWFIHFDASFLEADFSMGYAISILDKARNRRQCRAGREWASCPLDAEAKALLKALTWMKDLNLKNCCFINDCQTLMKIMNGDISSEDQPWRAQRSINRCKFSAYICNSIFFLYKARKFLDFEDRLAKEVRTRKISFFSTENMNTYERTRFLERTNQRLDPILCNEHFLYK